MRIRPILMLVCTAAMLTSVLPATAQEDDRFSWSGMIRTRLQGDYQGGTKSINRLMYGFFLNGTFRLSDRIDVTGRVMTGNPRAITVADWMSYGDMLVRESPYISWMYVNVRPNPSLTLTAGKFPLPFFRPTQVVLDSDLSPEGFAQQFRVDNEDGSSSFGVNLGQFVVNQVVSPVGGLDRTFFLGGQFVARFNQPGRSQTLAAAVYSVSGADSLFSALNRPSPLIVAANSNRANAAGTGYLSEYRMINLSAQYTQNINGQPLAVNADYVLNLGADDRRQGVTGMLTYGSTGPVGGTRGGVQAFLMQQDATLAPFSNIDYSQTNSRGFGLLLGRHLIERFVLDVHLYTRKHEISENIYGYALANNAWRTRLRVMLMFRLN